MTSSADSDEIPTAQISQLMNSMKINSETNKDYETSAHKDYDFNKEENLEKDKGENIEKNKLENYDNEKDRDDHYNSRNDDDYNYKKSKSHSHSRDNNDNDEYKKHEENYEDNYFKQKIDDEYYKKNSDEDHYKKQLDDDYYKKNSDEEYYKKHSDDDHYKKQVDDDYYKKHSEDNYYKKNSDDKQYKKNSDEEYYKKVLDDDYYKKDSVSDQIDKMIGDNNDEYKKYKTSHSRSRSNEDKHDNYNENNYGMTTELNNIILKNKDNSPESKDYYYNDYNQEREQQQQIKEDERDKDDFDEYENMSNTQKKLLRMDLLRKLAELKKKGYNISSEYSINSDYYTMKEEYIYQMSIKGKDSFIKNTFSYGLNFIKLIEFANKRYDPLGIDLDGWNVNVESSKEEIIDAISEIYEKYHKPGSGTMSPELRLLLILVSSAVSTVIANSGAKVLASMFKNSEIINEKDKKDVLKNLSQNLNQNTNQNINTQNQNNVSNITIPDNLQSFIPTNFTAQQNTPINTSNNFQQFTNLRDYKKQESLKDINSVVNEIKNREYQIPPPKIPLSLKSPKPESANNIFNDMIEKQKLSKKEQF